MIIGIAGRAQCGKDTLARALQAGAAPRETRLAQTFHGAAGHVQLTSQHTRDAVQILHFADALRDVVQAAFGSRYETAAEKDAVDQWWKERLSRPALGRSDLTYYAEPTGRRILQFVGTELFRNMVHQDFWLFAMERRIASSQAKHHIIADVRFDNEAEWIRRQGGQVIGLARADHPPLQADAHASEKGVRWDLIDHPITCDSVSAVETFGAVFARHHLT